MNVLRSFERRLEGLVEGTFAKTFRSGLQPVELAKRVLREMDSGRTVGTNGVWVPNRYEFRLSEGDRERFAGAEQVIVGQLREVVRDGARERGWGLLGPPEVEFTTDGHLKKGVFRCRASMAEGPGDGSGDDGGESSASGGGAAMYSPPSAAELCRIENGRRTAGHPLFKPVTTLGRQTESDVVVPDNAASRAHAEIRNAGAGEFSVVDLGSTNGTLVNNARIADQILRDGDRITIGTTEYEFREVRE